MSYPSEDRHERDVPSVQTRNPSQEMERHEKSKLMGGTAGVPIAMQDSGAFHRQQIEQAALKAGKPLQNRPIAPASGSIGGILPGHLVPGGLPGFGGAPVPGHPLIASAPIPLASMIRVAQPAFSHVPAGAAAGALAGVTPRSATALRTPAVPPVKPPGHTSQSHSAHGQSQLHTPATTTGSSHPSSPGPGTTPLATVAVSTCLHQQVSELKQSDLREARPGIVPEITRRGASPHCSSPVVQSTGPSHPSASTGSKIIPVASSALSQAHPGQKPTLSMLPSHLHSSSVHGSIPATVAGSSISSTMSLMPTMAHAMAAHTQQTKIPPNTLSVIPAAMAAQGKVYTHPHHLAFTAPRQTTIPSSDTNASDHSRLSKANGSASPAAVSTLHTSTVSAVSHLGASLNSVAGGENRLERTHQALPVPSQFPYHHGMAAGFLYPDALSVHPHAASLHAQYHQPAYGPLSSLARTQQGVATSAAAAAAQVAAAAAAGVNSMHIVDPSRILFQQAALGVGASGIGSLGGMDTPVTGGMMDISGATAGIYSVPLLTVPPSASIQAQLSAQNPNATSPRPSILRKRTIEGVRKPTTQVPYNEVLPSNQTEAAASPRSDSTLSASHSTQNSPKPPSDAGSQQPSEPAVTTASFTTADVQPVSQSVPASPIKIKSEPPSETPVSTVTNTAMVNDSASLPARVTALVSKVLTASSEAASPRKKPRKQNVVATEDKYGSNVSMGPDSPTNEEVKAKQDEDEDLKFILLKRPKISIVGGYKINTKAAHNHFQRYSDVKVKEEKKPSIQEIASQKGIVQRANGWRIQHIAGQMDELVSAEQDVLKKMGELRDRIPKVKPGQKTKYQDELVMLNELLQGNIQRSQLVVEQLGDSRKSMVKVLEHRPKVIDIIQKQMNKRNPKKKN